jgi:hypothetical protein
MHFHSTTNQKSNRTSRQDNRCLLLASKRHAAKTGLIQAGPYRHMISASDNRNGSHRFTARRSSDHDKSTAWHYAALLLATVKRVEKHHEGIRLQKELHANYHCRFARPTIQYCRPGATIEHWKWTG